MRVVIASDFHLKFNEAAKDRERRERVVRFLRSLHGRADVLVLNGDIFDLWFVWRQVIVRGYFGILRELADLADSGVKLVFVAGNHDFWFRDFLSTEMNAEICRDCYRLTVDGKKLFVAHGDAYTTGDLRYQVFRRLVRNPVVMWLFSLLHPDLALWLGRQMSRTSRRVLNPPRVNHPKQAGLRRKGEQLLAGGADFVVFGHTHVPAIEALANGVLANSGDWLKHSSYVVVEGGQMSLHTFENSKEEDI
ncbi:MAG: UDP-2,3-diacylglucosamine diphosphatase [Candidatus Cloacimonetes bacterium]|nr:UDP-2,3-diacylglucosamine diphosphatase [Candidatus Cloacimonadota bacterium]